MNLKFFRYEVKDSVLVLTMNRPEVRNAWNQEMHEEYFRALKKANEDDLIKVIILTGEPPAFSAGTDLKAFEGGGSGFGSVLSEDKEDSPVKLMREFRKPVIAAINGAAVGMGITITFMCDIRIAAESAKMSMRFTKIGVIPEFASPYMLPRLVGFGRAMELCLTARFFDAQEALDMGLVTRVVPDEQLMPAAMELAEELAGREEHAIQKTREVLYRSLDDDFYETIRKEPGEFKEAVLKTFGKKAQE